jgi:hypothetical protein
VSCPIVVIKMSLFLSVPGAGRKRPRRGDGLMMKTNKARMRL